MENGKWSVTDDEHPAHHLRPRSHRACGGGAGRCARVACGRAHRPRRGARRLDADALLPTAGHSDDRQLTSRARRHAPAQTARRCAQAPFDRARVRDRHRACPSHRRSVTRGGRAGTAADHAPDPHVAPRSVEHAARAAQTAGALRRRLRLRQSRGGRIVAKSGRAESGIPPGRSRYGHFRAEFPTANS